MHNVVFLNIDKIDNDFQANNKELEELRKLIENIKKVNPQATNDIVLISNNKYGDVNYKLHLLQAYLSALHVNDKSINMGVSFTQDRALHGLFSLDDNRRVDDKMFAVINDMTNSNILIDSIISISRCLEFKLLDEASDYKHIVLSEDFEDAKSPIDIDTEFGKDITYLISPKKGLKGYNECFDTYFEHQDSVKLSK